MVAQSKSPYMAPQQYLAWEREQEMRYEYHDGKIVAMSGGTLEHAVIISNIIRRLGERLDASPCTTIGSVMRVYVDECNRYFYPDVSVVCGAPSYTDGRRDTIVNPALVVEVLSDSTEHVDRTTKWDWYGVLPSIHTYLIVSQSEPRIEKYCKVPGKNSWEATAYNGVEAVVSLAAIGCELYASEVYHRIEFDSNRVNRTEPGSNS